MKFKTNSIFSSLINNISKAKLIHLSKIYPHESILFHFYLDVEKTENKKEKEEKSHLIDCEKCVSSVNQHYFIVWVRFSQSSQLWNHGL